MAGLSMGYITTCIINDPKAQRRGVVHVELHEQDWADLGDPLSIWLGELGWVPIEPTGRKRGDVRWRHKKKRGLALCTTPVLHASQRPD